MRSFALALTAIAVEAYNPWGASPQHTGHSHQQTSYPQRQTYSSQQSYHAPSHQQHAHTSQHQHAPAHNSNPWATTATTPSHSGHVVNPWASSNGHYYSGHGHTHVAATIPDGWFSATQQYFQKVKFVPTSSKVTIFACCNLEPVVGQTITGLVEFAQLPNKPTTVKSDNLTNLGDTQTFELQIHEHGKTGNISTLSATVTCDNVGDEFNPYLEATNAFAEPNRGEIDEIVGDTATEPQTFLQEKLIQNLGGQNHIIGRSLVIYETADLDTPLACCVIGQAADPNAAVVDPATVTTVNWKYAAAYGVHPSEAAHSHGHAGYTANSHTTSHAPSHSSSAHYTYAKPTHQTYAKPTHSNYVGW